MLIIILFYLDLFWVLPQQMLRKLKQPLSSWWALGVNPWKAINNRYWALMKNSLKNVLIIKAIYLVWYWDQDRDLEVRKKTHTPRVLFNFRIDSCRFTCVFKLDISKTMCQKTCLSVDYFHVVNKKTLENVLSNSRYKTLSRLSLHMLFWICSAPNFTGIPKNSISVAQ